MLLSVSAGGHHTHTHTRKELKAFRRHGNRVGPIKATHLNQLDTVTAALEAAAAGNKVALMCKFATIIIVFNEALLDVCLLRTSR